jgi:hypothetical protein
METPRTIVTGDNMLRNALLAALGFLVFGTAVAQQQPYYPPPNPSTEARPPVVNHAPPPNYPAPAPPSAQPAPPPQQGGQAGVQGAPATNPKPADPNAPKKDPNAPAEPEAKEEKKPEVPLIDKVEDALHPAVTTLKGVERVTPLTQGRTWRIHTRGVEGGAGGRQYWLKKQKMAPVKLRTERWDEGEMVVSLPKDSITAGGTYRLELHQDGALLAARTVQVVAALPDDFDGDGAGRDRDCDDFDARRHPNAKEVCDDAGLDEDCNLETVVGEKAYVDVDGDGFGVGEPVLICDKAKIGKGLALVGGDCADYDAKKNPKAGCPAK